MSLCLIYAPDFFSKKLRDKEIHSYADIFAIPLLDEGNNHSERVIGTLIGTLIGSTLQILISSYHKC